jgi:hypothetical protein
MEVFEAGRIDGLLKGTHELRDILKAWPEADIVLCHLKLESRDIEKFVDIDTSARIGL